MIRKARISDIKTIQEIINSYAKKGDLLPRSINELYENMRDFLIYEEEGEIIGITALHITWYDLAEVRSLVVKKKGLKGIGTSLIKECIKEAEEIGIVKVFTLTRAVGFFKKIGFKEIDKSLLPQKIWSDCIKCIKFPECDEKALIYDIAIQT